MQEYSLRVLGISAQSVVIHGIMTLPLLNIEIFHTMHAQVGCLENGG